MAGGAPRSFIGAGAAPGRGGRELIAGVNGSVSMGLRGESDDGGL
jgi:hypothetical protein